MTAKTKNEKTSITLRLSAKDKKEVEKVMLLLFEKTKSKAFLRLPRDYIEAKKTIEKLEAEIRDIRNRLDDLEVLKYDAQSVLKRIMGKK